MLLLMISTSPKFSPDESNSNFHDFMLLFKKSYTLFAISNISKHSLSQPWGTMA